MEQALNAPGPAVIEAYVDPNEPPMPPKVKPEQALHLAESLARGTPERGKIMKTIFKDKIRELV
jgi:pyruvate dehydrogenase (quinone)/pyruvate oxidase